MSHLDTLHGEYRFLPLEAVIFGKGALSRLPEEMDRLGLRRALVLAGNTLATKTDLIGRVRDLLGERCAGAYHGLTERCPVPTVLEATRLALEAEADTLVGVGGSTISDAARVITVLAANGITQDRQLREWFPRVQAQGGVSFEGKRALAQIAVPTTLSAGEMNRGGGTLDDQAPRKIRFSHPLLAPKLVVYDPEMTTATPDWLWLSTGIKALDHAIERLYGPGAQPATEATCLRATELLFASLPRSAEHPSDLEARLQCLVGAWLSMQGMPNGGLGLSHAIGHILGVERSIPHGYTSCVTQPYVMEFNLPASVHQQALFARAAGVEARGMSDEAAAVSGHNRVHQLIQGLKLPHRLRQVGVGEGDLPAIAASTLDDPSARHNVIPVTTPDQVLPVLRAAY